MLQVFLELGLASQQLAQAMWLLSQFFQHKFNTSLQSLVEDCIDDLSTPDETRATVYSKNMIFRVCLLRAVGRFWVVKVYPTIFLVPFCSRKPYTRELEP